MQPEKEIIEAVQRMQDYIVKNINCDITIKALSNAAGYSEWHACRIFKELTGKAPLEYVRALRLTHAAIELRDTECQVIDAALESSFESHDGFTRAFSRQFAINPNKYKKEKPPVQYFVHYPVKHYYFHKNNRSDINMNNQKVPSAVTVTVREMPQRKLIILRATKATEYFAYCEEKGCEWEGLLNSIPVKMDTAAFIALPPKFVTTGTSGYAAGVEVPFNYSGTLPNGYDVIELEPSSVFYFNGMPYENEEDFGIAIDIVQNAIDSYKPELYGYSFAYDNAPAFNFGATAKDGARMAVPCKKNI